MTQTNQVVEGYRALDANSRSLAIMGARAVRDMVLVEQVGRDAEVRPLRTSYILLSNIDILRTHNV